MPFRRRSLFALVLGLLLVPATISAAAQFSGTVVRVVDGDTLDVLRPGRAVRVRLADIDCPEASQAYGRAAKRAAADLAFGASVTVLVRDRDRYGRLVGEVLLADGRSLNRELLRDGYAWWYRRYSADRSLGVLEAEARARRRGLWADPAPVAPWEFRRRPRKQRRAPPL